MVESNLASVEGGTSPQAASPGNDGGGLHTDGESFWQSNSDYLRTLSSRIGVDPNQQAQEGQRQAPQGIAADEFEQFRQWKAAREGKDVRGLLDMAGLQPGDVLNATLFGGPATQEAPKEPDPVETVRNELTQLRQDIENERRERQTVAERITESNAKKAFSESVRSMPELTVLQKWGDEAVNTAWNIYVQDAEEVLQARKRGEQLPMPSPRQAALKVEKYLRGQAERLGDIFGGAKAALEPLQFDLQTGAPSQAATEPAPIKNHAGSSPTLQNVGGHVGAPSDGPVTVEELRKRALEAGKRLRG